MRGHIVAVASLVAAGCGAAVFQSRDIALEQGGRSISIADDTGDIIVGKRHVGRIDDKGKITNSRGQPLAFVFEDSIRLRGGAVLPVKVVPDGATYVPETAQREAGLTPVASRIRPDGRVASSKNAAGVQGQGLGTPRARRVLLAVMVLSENSMW